MTRVEPSVSARGHFEFAGWHVPAMTTLREWVEDFGPAITLLSTLALLG